MTCTRLTAALAMAALFAVGSANASLTNIIYQEDFSGSGDPLNGTAVSPVDGTTLWQANSFALDDGTINGADEGAAILPFTPQAGVQYCLELDVTPNSNTDNRWIGLGLTEVTTLASAGASNYIDRFAHNNSRGWMLVRDHPSDMSQDIQLFQLNTSNQVSETTEYDIVAGTTYSLRIDYFANNLNDATATYYIDDNLPASAGGDGVDGYVTLLSDVGLYLTDVHSVGWTFDNATSTPPTVDNFVFSSNVPEPTSIALCGLVGMFSLAGYLRGRWG